MKLLAGSAHRKTIPSGPALADYDVIVVNSSAGKDSQAMLHFVATLATQAGVLDRVTVVHAELDEEWHGTKDLAKSQAAAYGLPFEAVKRPQGNLLAHVEKRGMWPSSSTRYCTSDHKRGQVAKVITKLCDDFRRAHGLSKRTPVRVLNCLGIRAAESSARAKKSRFARDARLTGEGTSKIVDTWHPIFDLGVLEVWTVIKRFAGAEALIHPAYGLGMPRLSCVFCVFAPPAALLLAGKHNPELLAKYVAVERRIGHTFRKDLSIASIQEAVERGDEVGAISTWEM